MDKIFNNRSGIITFIRRIMKDHAWKFIILLGFVSLFGDMTYEGARSITGPYLQILGASAVVVGVVSGLGELIGYMLRFLSGYLSDKTRKYWTITIVGYAVNLLAVPLLALAGSWQIAAILIIMERFGKAIRTPARDVMLSHATSQVGSGWGFGFHEAMDQIGAIIGPLMVAFILYFNGSYRVSFAFLLFPAILALLVLIMSRFLYPHPHHLETSMPKLESKGFKKVYWLYIFGVALIAVGYADFPLIAYHFQQSNVVLGGMIAIFYAVAMGVDAISALIFGKLFDKVGISIMILIALVSSFFAPLVFLGGFYMALIGMSIWGIGMGAQESIMRAVVAEMSTVKKRGISYGIFNSIFGVFWFTGSVIMGLLYGVSLVYLVIFSMIMQLSSIPIFIMVRDIMNQDNQG
jgi:MFS family permease